jgi:hypothetical protein
MRRTRDIKLVSDNRRDESRVWLCAGTNTRLYTLSMYNSEEPSQRLPPPVNSLHHPALSITHAFNLQTSLPTIIIHYSPSPSPTTPFLSKSQSILNSFRAGRADIIQKGQLAYNTEP